MSNKIKVDHWSRCCGEWMHYDYFETKEEAEAYITKKGYDPRYFRIDT